MLTGKAESLVTLDMVQPGIRGLLVSEAARQDCNSASLLPLGGAPERLLVSGEFPCPPVWQLGERSTAWP